MFLELFTNILICIITITTIILTYLTKGDKNSKLIKCPDCGKKISINAKTCIKCNAELNLSEEDKKSEINNNSFKKYYKSRKIILLLYQIILGISIVLIFEVLRTIITELVVLTSLIINTINILLFNIINNRKRKDCKIMISIMSILAIILGTIFSVNYIIQFKNHSSHENREDLQAVLNLEEYDKDDAEDLLENIYESISGEKDNYCLNLYNIMEEKRDTYTIWIYDKCRSMYMPVNSLYMEIDNKDETEVKRIYWQFNDELQIDIFNIDKTNYNTKYYYIASMYDEEPHPYIKRNFEQEIKEQLISPSSAIFTYNGIRYSTNANKFVFTGWVESQNEYSAMIKKDFKLVIEASYDKNLDLNYSWSWE